MNAIFNWICPSCKAVNKTKSKDDRFKCPKCGATTGMMEIVWSIARDDIPKELEC